MALPGINIEIQNGALGQVIDTPDGVCGLILQGVAADQLALGEAAQLYTLTDAETLGIDSTYDSGNSVQVWKHIREFYDEAGEGAELWIILIAQAISMEDLADINNSHAKTLLNAAQGRIRILGITRNPLGGYSPTLTNNIDQDVITAIPKAQALAQAYADKFSPIRVILEGYGYTGVPAGLPVLSTMDNNRTAVLLGNTVSGPHQAVGLLLGRLARIPVQRNPGRVKDGSLNITQVYLNADKLESVLADSEAIHQKNYITFRSYVSKAGYYFTDDPTATGATDDYNSLARGRVIDKVIVLAYGVYVQEVLDEIQVDSEGKINPAKTAYYQAIIANQVNQAMTFNLEISSFRAYVDPNQNVLSTGKLEVKLFVTPVGYAKEIRIKLGFENPALN